MFLKCVWLFWDVLHERVKSKCFIDMIHDMCSQYDFLEIDMGSCI